LFAPAFEMAEFMFFEEDTTMENKRLYKSEVDRKICGVCGGIAEYFNIDPTFVRVGWVLASLFLGSGLLAYIIAAIIMPTRP